MRMAKANAADMRQRIQQAKKGKPARLKPLVTAWMLANQDHEFSDAAIDVAVETLKRARRRPKYLRNSPSAGHHDFCDRRAVIAFNGYSQEPVNDIVTLNKFADGNYGHLMWQLRLFEMGFLAGEFTEVFLNVPHWGVAGTADGILSVPMEGWDPGMTREEVRALVDSGDVPVWWSLLEVKRMASYRFRNAVASGDTESKIHWQGANYWMGANRLLKDHFEERGRGETVEDVCYWHENKDSNEFIEFDIVPADTLIDQMSTFYGQVIKDAGGHRLPPRPFEDGSRECNGCWFAERCRRLERKGKTKMSPAPGKVYDRNFPEPQED